MSLLYALIARGSTVLCDYTNKTGNFETITVGMLGRLSEPGPTAKVSYKAGQFTYHVICEDGLAYLVLADGSFPAEQAYKYLSDVRRRFTQGPLVERAITAKAYELRRDFSHVLGSRLEYFSEERPDRLHELTSQVDEVKGIMVKNIERVLERGEKLDILVNKTEELDRSASTFKKNTRQLQQKMWWKNVKWIVVIVIVILLLLAIIIMAATGVFS